MIWFVIIWNRSELCKIEAGIPFDEKHTESACTLFHLAVEQSHKERLQLQRISSCSIESKFQLLKRIDIEKHLLYHFQ